MFSALAADCTVDCAIELVLITLHYITLGPCRIPQKVKVTKQAAVIMLCAEKYFKAACFPLSAGPRSPCSARSAEAVVTLVR